MPRVELSGGCVLVLFDEPMDVLTTAEPAGLTKARGAAICKVDETSAGDLGRLKPSLRGALGLGAGDPILLTAADVSRYALVGDGGSGVVATVGIDEESCRPRAAYEPPRASTVNLIAWTSEALTLGGMLDLFRTVVEAKAAAVALLLPSCPGLPTGTITDAVALAARRDDSRGYLWAGRATTVGGRVYEMVLKAVTSRAPPAEERLAWVLGVSLDDLVEDAIKLYRLAPVPGVGEEAVRDEVARELRALLRDPNVWALVISSRLLDVYGEQGAIPGLGAEEFKADTKKVVADELLASALSIYVNGFKGLLAAYWADRSKEAAGLSASRLPMFEDDVAGALAAAALSRVYDRLLAR